MVRRLNSNRVMPRLEAVIEDLKRVSPDMLVQWLAGMLRQGSPLPAPGYSPT